MQKAKQRFLKELAKEIGDHPHKKHILMDYELHIQELITEKLPSNDQEKIYHFLLQRLGTPVEIAKLWTKEMNVTPRKTQWLFLISNLTIFIGGILLILGYRLFHWHWVGNLWLTLTDIPVLLIFIYLIFWGLLGYEIGKEFGHRGKRLLRKIYYLSIIPSIFINYLVMLRMIPVDWFPSFAKLPLIAICIIFTGLLYPVSKLGYLWGRKVSI